MLSEEPDLTRELDRCRTYFNVALRECPHCGMFWCPRCRAWFAAPVSAFVTAKKAGR
jgi:hypothetical protein